MDTHATTRLLFVSATLLGIGGCQNNSDAISKDLSDIRKSIDDLKQEISTLRAAIPTSHSTDSATEAVTLAGRRLDQHQFVAAYDLLLAAIRQDPYSPSVFDATMRFTQEASQEDDDVALDLAYDLYVRAAGLIPFQPLSEIASARDKFAKFGELFEPTEQFVVRDPLETIRTRITETKTRRLPGQIASLVVQVIRSELESVAVNIGNETSAASDDFWETWHDLNNELEAFETEILAAMYEELGQRVASWENGTTEVLKQYEDAKPQDLSSIGHDIVAKVHAGYRLRSEIVPFAEAGIDAAKSQQDQIDNRLDYLERTREWIHNQHALAAIKFVRQSNQLTPIEKLKRLANYDERRLSPYVLQRYQEEWNQWFEELNGEEQQIEATRIRILGGASK